MNKLIKVQLIFTFFMIFHLYSFAQIEDGRHHESFGDVIKISLVDQNTILEFQIDAIRSVKNLVNIDSALTWLQRDLLKVQDSINIDMPIKILYSGISVYSRRLKIDPNPGSLDFTFDDKNGSIIKKFKYIVELNLYQLSSVLINKKSNLSSYTYKSPYPGNNSKFLIYTNDLSSIAKLPALHINQYLHQAIDSIHPRKEFRRVTISTYALYTDNRADKFKRTSFTKGNKNDFEAICYLGLGLSVIQSEIIPSATIKMLFPIRINYKMMTEVGLNYSLYINPKADNNHNVDINQLIGIEFKYTNLLTKKYYGTYYGKLLKHEGNFLKKDTYYMGVYYPVSKRLSINLTYFKAEEQSMLELGFKFWIY